MASRAARIRSGKMLKSISRRAASGGGAPERHEDRCLAEGSRHAYT
jgi:hypothetical protein